MKTLGKLLLMIMIMILVIPALAKTAEVGSNNAETIIQALQETTSEREN